MKRIVRMVLLTMGMLSPLVAFATSHFTIDYLFQRAADIINDSVLVGIGIAVVVFMWGIIQYILAQGDEKKLAEGRKVMIYGVFGLFMIVAVWGLVNLLVFTIFGDTTGSASPFDFSIPTIQ